MPKIKTLKAAAKRFKKTASGKFTRRHAFHSHILTKKSAKRKRRLRGEETLTNPDMAAVRRMLPYAE